VHPICGIGTHLFQDKSIIKRFHTGSKPEVK